MSLKTKFNLEQYFNQSQYNGTIEQFTEELKYSIENDYDFCQQLYNNYKNFNEIVDQTGAVIVNKPQLDLYSKAVENAQIDSWRSSSNVDEKALWYQYNIKSRFEDKDSQQAYYDNCRELLMDSLELDMAHGGLESAIRETNIEIDALDKAAQMLGLRLYNEAGTEETGEEEEEPSENSEEEEEILDKDKENKEAEYLIIPTTDSSGNTTQQVVKLFKEFTFTGAAGISLALGAALVANWKACSNNMAKDFQPDLPIPDPAEREVDPNLFVKLAEHISEKLRLDITEQCELVRDGIETKSDGKWTNEHT